MGIDEQFTALEAMLIARFDQIDARFDGIDKRFEGVDDRFDQVDKQFDQVDKRFDRVEAHLDDHDRRFTQIDTQLLQLDVRTEATATAVIRLEENENRLIDRVDANNERIDKLAYWLMWALVAVFSSILVGIGLSVAIAAAGS